MGTSKLVPLSTADQESMVRKDSQKECREMLAQIFINEGHKDLGNMLLEYDLRFLSQARQSSSEIAGELRQEWEWFVESIGYSVTSDEDCLEMLSRIKNDIGNNDILDFFQAVVNGGVGTVINDPIENLTQFVNLGEDFPDYEDIIVECAKYFLTILQPEES